MSELSTPDPSQNKPTAAEKQVIRAAKNGDIATLRTLIKATPALLQARDTDGSTPLHCASWKGHTEAVSLLLDLGAEVNARNQNDHWGDTPLHAAAHGNQRAVAEILLKRGADPHAVNPRGNTPLAETAIHNATSVANLLKRYDTIE